MPLAIVATAVFGIYKFAFSEVAPAVDWISTQPNVVKVNDLQSSPVYPDLYSNRDCTPTNVSVMRGAANAVTENQCMVSTAFGQMEQQGDLVQANGYSKTYPLVKYPGSSNRALLPVPNQGSAIEVAPYPTGVGVTLDLYKSLYGHMKTAFPAAGTQLQLFDPPEEHFKYGDNTYMRFNVASLSFSHNGQFFIADTITNGFMKTDLLNLGKQPIAISLPRDSSGSTLQAATAIDDDGKFAAIAYGAPGGWGTPYFKIVDTSSCTGSFNSNSSSQPTFSCSTVDLRSKLESTIPNLVEVRNVRFINSRTITFVASFNTSTGRKYTRYSMTAGGQKPSLESYLAIGDSYISGEGAYDYRTGTDTERNRCHQSTLSYPYILGSVQSSFASVACSGARTYNIQEKVKDQSDQVYNGEPTISEVASAKDTHLPGYIQQYSFVQNDNPDAVTVSIGGNDIRFSDIITSCVHPFQNLKGNVISHHTCYSTYEERLQLVNFINDQQGKLYQLYRDLRDSGPTTRRVNVLLNADEVSFAHDLIEYFDSVIKRAADAAGVVYVDTQSAFDGARLCEGNGENNAVNGFTLNRQSWGGVGFAESYHPNKNGHQRLASTIAAQTSNLTKAMPDPGGLQPITSVNQNMPLLRNAPRSNAPIFYLKALGEDLNIIGKGSVVQTLINGANYFVKPNSPVRMVLHSDPVELGTVNADAQGNVNASAMIPSGVEPGFHTLDFYGTDIFGNPIDMQRTVFVAASADDYDSDGVSNAADSCPLAAQSGFDKDVDGIDDVCDSQVTAPPPTPPDPEGIIWRDDTVLELTINAVSSSGQ